MTPLWIGNRDFEASFSCWLNMKSSHMGKTDSQIKHDHNYDHEKADRTTTVQCV